MSITLNDQQKEAFDSAVRWYKDYRDGRTRQRIFFLSGYAGTGKTTVARIVAEACAGDRVAFIAPTGKAASRLRQKGCHGAKTLHQFLYRVAGTKDDGDGEEPIFVSKGSLDERPLLIIMDEACMVGQWDVNNLERLNIPVLALGDIGQVPPVKAAAYFKQGSEDYLLTDIMRQGENSNIIRASFFVRNGGRLPPREYDDVKVRVGRPTQADIRAHCGENAVMLCAYNSTRQLLNTRARIVMGFDSPLPAVGEKVVCTFNQHETGIMNGEQGIVLGYEELGIEQATEDENNGLMWLRMKSLTSGNETKVFFNPLCFTIEDQDLKQEFYRSKGGFDFGWALTVHKSQGSEWDNVLLMEETLSSIPYAKLIYTGITRAAKSLLFFRKD